MRLTFDSLVLVIATAFGLASAQQCDPANPLCRGNIGATWETQQHASADYAFYHAPSNFSTGLPEGHLLHVEEITDLTNYTVPAGLTMSRIIYTTADLHGSVIPTSAYILWPYSRFQASGSDSQCTGFPLVAWAHGTSGVLKGCAPSNYRNLQYHFMAPFLLATQGMAVVAPDYAGLGIDSMPSGEPIKHPWGAGPAQANDVANAILAARSAFPQYLKPSGPFVAMGHSQGGQAVWSLTERMVDRPIPGYKGTVSIAPPNNLIAAAEEALADPSLPWAGTLLTAQPKLIASVTHAFPAYNYSGMSPMSYSRWHNIMEPLSVCLPTDVLVFSDIAVQDLAQPGWTQDETVQEYSALIQTSRRRFVGPLLVLAGESDTVVPFQTIESAVDDTCAMLEEDSWDESMELITYPGINHFSVIQASQMQWLAWIKERFGSNSTQPNLGCSKSTINGFRTEHTAPDMGAPNFLQGWTDQGWMYVL